MPKLGDRVIVKDDFYVEELRGREGLLIGVVRDNIANCSYHIIHFDGWGKGHNGWIDKKSVRVDMKVTKLLKEYTPYEKRNNDCLLLSTTEFIVPKITKKQLKIALLNAMELLQEKTGLVMYDIEKELGLPMNTYMKLEGE